MKNFNWKSEIKEHCTLYQHHKYKEKYNMFYPENKNCVYNIDTRIYTTLNSDIAFNHMIIYIDDGTKKIHPEVGEGTILYSDVTYKLWLCAQVINKEYKQKVKHIYIKNKIRNKINKKSMNKIIVELSGDDFEKKIKL